MSQDQQLVLLSIRDAFYSWKPFGSVSSGVQSFVQDLSDDECASFQDKVCQVLSQLQLTSLPVEPDHKERFLKRLIGSIEALNKEVCDQLYQLLLERTPDTGGYYYKSYFLNETKIVSLAERPELISTGTTGLRTWQAAPALVQFISNHPEEIKGKEKVLELGSGSGFVGISLMKLNLVKKELILTDHHEDVLKYLRHNCQVNQLPQDQHEVVTLDWLTFDQGQAGAFDPDLVLASDVVFDPDLIPGLARTLRLLLKRHDQSAAVACTLRNQNTIDLFLDQIRDQGLHVSKVQDTLHDQDRVLIYKFNKPQ